MFVLIYRDKDRQLNLELFKDHLSARKYLDSLEEKMVLMSNYWTTPVKENGTWDLEQLDAGKYLFFSAFPSFIAPWKKETPQTGSCQNP